MQSKKSKCVANIYLCQDIGAIKSVGYPMYPCVVYPYYQVITLLPFLLLPSSPTPPSPSPPQPPHVLLIPIWLYTVEPVVLAPTWGFVELTIAPPSWLYSLFDASGKHPDKLIQMILRNFFVFAQTFREKMSQRSSCLPVHANKEG